MNSIPLIEKLKQSIQTSQRLLFLICITFCPLASRAQSQEYIDYLTDPYNTLEFAGSVPPRVMQEILTAGSIEPLENTYSEVNFTAPQAGFVRFEYVEISNYEGLTFQITIKNPDESLKLQETLASGETYREWAEHIEAVNEGDIVSLKFTPRFSNEADYIPYLRATFEVLVRNLEFYSSSRWAELAE